MKKEFTSKLLHTLGKDYAGFLHDAATVAGRQSVSIATSLSFLSLFYVFCALYSWFSSSLHEGSNSGS